MSVFKDPSSCMLQLLFFFPLHWRHQRLRRLFISYDDYCYLHYFSFCTECYVWDPYGLPKQGKRNVWLWSKVMTALMKHFVSSPQVNCPCILHEGRQVLNIILNTVFSETGIYLNMGNQKNPYHSRVRKYLMVWVKVIVGNNFQKQFHLFLSNFPLFHSHGL